MNTQLKVVHVIDDYKVAINAGSNSGIKLGQRYLVYKLSSEEIIDPDSNTSLGFLEIVKGSGKVVHVQETMCTLESDSYATPTKRIVRKSPLVSVLADSIEETEQEQLPYDHPKVGDLVKRIN